MKKYQEESNSIHRNISLLITFMVVDFKLRYRNSFLGFGWLILEPLLMLVILYAVFSTILKNDILFFPIYLITGLLLYNVFSRSTGMATDSIVAKAGILSAIKLQRIVLPLASNLTALVIMVIEISVLAVFILFFQLEITSTIFVLPLMILILIVLSVGISLPLSALNVFSRDVSIMWRVIVQALFFLSAIFYDIDMMPENLSSLLKLNPLAMIIDISQNALIYNEMPSGYELGLVSITSIGVLVGGILVFKKLNHRMNEQL